MVRLSLHICLTQGALSCVTQKRDIQDTETPSSGATGLDGTVLLPPPTKAPITSTPAIVAIRDALLAQPRDTAWVVATGALTNIGLLFAVFPELVAHIAGLSIMGGAIGGGFTDAPMGKVEGEGKRIGNTTPWAEFNIYVSFFRP